MPQKDRDCDIDQVSGLPTCSTGPFARMTWTIRELLSMVRGPRGPKESNDVSSPD